MAGNNIAPQPAKSRREQFGERLKKKYPDREYADDEALFGQISDDYDNYDAEIGKYKDREKELADLFANSPSSARFITDMAKGKDPWLAVIDRLGIDGVTDLINNPDKQKEYAEANKKYVEKLAKEKSLEEEFQKNMLATTDMLEKMQEERGISDDKMDAAMDLVWKIMGDAIVGKVTPETVDIALKAIDHDADVATARNEGEVAGRNANIEAKLRKPNKGDGTPNLAGSNNAPTRQKGKKPMNIFDYADAAK